MRTIFDEILTAGEGILTKLVAQQQQEGLQIDFKQKRTPSHANWEKDDQKVVAKAMSAFSNSHGGLIVFGVDARKGPDGIDAAVALQPIANIAAFASQGLTLVGQLLMPKHDGILLEAVPAVSAPGSGYLAIWVDRSERRPHRSEAAGDKQYYKRSGDNSFAMEHYDIEDAFNRHAPTELRINWHAKRGSSTTSGGKTKTSVSIVISLYNPSRVTATMPYLFFKKLLARV